LSPILGVADPTNLGELLLFKVLLALPLATAAIGFVMARFAYVRGGVQSALLALFVPIGNFILNLVLFLILLMFLQASLNAAQQVLASRFVPMMVAPRPFPQTTQPAPSPPNFDARVAQTVRIGPPFIFEGRQWSRLNRFQPGNQSAADFIARLYAAGANRVSIMAFGDFKTFFVELPTIPDQRRACFDLADQFRSQNRNVRIYPTLANAGRFLVIEALLQQLQHP